MSRAFALLVLFFLPSVLVTAAEFYQSNELGMALTPISEAKKSEIQWVLEVQRSGRSEVRRLTDNGKPYSRWEVAFEGGRVASESMYHKGELASTTDYRNGRPIRQTEYSAGKLSTVRKYEYSGNLLKSVSVYDSSGTLLYRDLYNEGSDGRMRRAVRETPDGTKKVISLNFSGDSLISEWLGAGGDGELLRYSDGSVVSTEQWKGTELLSEEAVSPSANGSMKVTTDYKTGIVTRRSYDEAGQIVSEVQEKDGNVAKTVQYTYTDGKITRRLTKTPGRREETRYQYDKSGKLQSTETTVNRQLTKVTHYTDKDTFLEDLYLNGELVLHAYYEKGKLVREVPASSGNAGVTKGSGG